MNTYEQCTRYIGIVVDANSRIGTGHITRTMILAKKLKALGYIVHYLTANTDLKICEWIELRGFVVHRLSDEIRESAENTLLFIAEQSKGKSMLLFDSDLTTFYKVNYQQALRAKNVGIAMIVFNRAIEFDVDILHNQNPISTSFPYMLQSETQKLCGLENLIVKDEYQVFHQKSKAKKIADIKTILLTFGGSDAEGLTLRLLKIFNRLPSTLRFQINVVVGVLNKDIKMIEKMVLSKRHEYSLHINTEQMPRLMYESDLSINSGGLTVWELACCKTLSFVIPTSERETVTAEYLAADSLIFYEDRCANMTDIKIESCLIKILSASQVFSDLLDKFHSMVNPFGADNFIHAIENWFNNERYEL